MNKTIPLIYKISGIFFFWLPPAAAKGGGIFAAQPQWKMFEF